ncbi:hypothetical protein ElyMa_004766800 [Elysia marginata]|uniref:Ig-like domain-containing protein n=1 Tax=Elysia marginata TaxID=1093978 RepID=A0AAV4IH83_9GAST|nr:hypothetical protein ElyMa_004766800 [Elysia marginata]
MSFHFIKLCLLFHFVTFIFGVRHIHLGPAATGFNSFGVNQHDSNQLRNLRTSPPDLDRAAPRKTKSKNVGKNAIVLSNRVSLAPDAVMVEGKVITITCNAEVVRVKSKYKLISSLTLSRQLYGENSRTQIAFFNPYNSATPIKNSTNFPDSRKWDIQFYGAPKVPTATRGMTIALTINDAKCSDAGLYECRADYLDRGPFPLFTAGQQNISSKGKAPALFFF